MHSETQKVSGHFPCAPCAFLCCCSEQIIFCHLLCLRSMWSYRGHVITLYCHNLPQTYVLSGSLSCGFCLAGALLDLLQRTGEKGYTAFLESLELDYPRVYSRITGKEPNKTFSILVGLSTFLFLSTCPLHNLWQLFCVQTQLGNLVWLSSWCRSSAVCRGRCRMRGGAASRPALLPRNRSVCPVPRLSKLNQSGHFLFIPVYKTVCNSPRHSSWDHPQLLRVNGAKWQKYVFTLWYRHNNHNFIIV